MVTKGPTFLVFIVMSLAAATPSAGAMRVDSSETLPPAGDIVYDPAKLTDRNIQTAWCVKWSDHSTAWFSVRFQQPTPLRVVGWFGGYQKSDRLFRANARAKTVAVWSDDRLLGRFALDDRMGPQTIELPGEPASEYRFVIETVYPGTTYADLCVTELLLDRRTLEGYALAADLAEAARSRALRDEEIDAAYRYLLGFWRGFFDGQGRALGPEHDRPFWDAVVLRTSARDEASLRFLLNLRHHAQQQHATSAELTEGLRDLVVTYFEDNPSAVAVVWEDERQAGRATIGNAYDMFADSWGSEASAKVWQYRATNPGFDRYVAAVCKEHGAASGGWPYFCSGD